MPRSFLFCLLLCYCSSAAAQGRTDAPLRDLLFQRASPQLRHVLGNPDSFHVQLIFTTITRNASGKPQFRDWHFQTDRHRYFNPASTVKMPLAFLALEKLRKLGIWKWTPMLTDSAWSGQTRVLTDTSAANGLPSIAQYIKKIFLVSDNDAYNRLYEFLGQQYLHDQLRAKGYKDVRIVRRFVPMSEEENRHTNPVRFTQNGETIYNQPAAYNPSPFDYSKQVMEGHSHWDKNDSLIHAPMDFTKHNYFPLEDLHRLLRSVIFPESAGKGKFDLQEEDYRFLYRWMAALPSESDHPRYDTAEFFDSYTKFFRFKDGRRKIPDHIRVFNKTGWSYGYLTDVAYFADFKNDVEFMVSGNIYVNRDGVLNDGKYEYEEVGYPFFREVGDILYNYTLEHRPLHRPDLSKFRESVAGLSEKPKAVIRGDTTKKRLALVFTAHEFADGGIHIAETLKSLGVKGSFFFTGEFYENPAFAPLVARLQADGNYLGPHSGRHLLYCDWKKRDSLLVTRPQFESDLDMNLRAMARLGLPEPHFFLPPYEWYNDTIVQWTNDLGMQLVNFTPGTRSNADYTYPEMGKSYVSSDRIYASIVEYEAGHPGGLDGFLLLLHAGTDARRPDKFYFQLRKLIRYLQLKDYELVVVPRLLPRQ